MVSAGPRKRRLTPQEREAVAADLRWRFARDCQAAGLRPGGLLPSINELTARYRVTLAIARDFYRRLEAEGSVEAFQGKGVFLRRAPEAGGRPRALNLGVVAYLEYANPAHRYNRACAVLSAFEQLSAELGGSAHLFNLHPTRHVTLAMQEEISAARPDGLLFLPSVVERREENIRKLQVLGIPLVVADQKTTSAHCVLFDHFQAACDATAYLRSLGLERLAFLQRRSSSAWAEERRTGFNRAGGGLAVELENNPEAPAFQAELEGLFPKLLAAGVQGVLCSGDPYAARLLDFARSRGVRVPEDLAIAGIDDNWMCRQLNLTTVQQSDFALGSAAHKLLSEIIAKPPDKLVERQLHCPLLARATTPPQTRHPQGD